MQPFGQPRPDGRAGPGEQGQGLQRQIGDDPVARRVEVMFQSGDRLGLFWLINPDFGEDLRQMSPH